VWATLWLIASPQSRLVPFCFFIRTATAMHNTFRLTRSFAQSMEALLTVVKDYLQLIIWLCSFVGNVVTWRGERFRVKRGGELVRIQG
jgi:hypothetical protein